MERYEQYKDSDIDWIGEIPEHWEVKKIKYLSKLQGGYAFKSDSFSKTGIPVIRIGDINNRIDWDNCKKIPDDIEIPKEFILRSNDTLIALSGATTGKTSFVTEKPKFSYINQRVAKVGFNNKLLFFNISSDFVKKLILLTADGSAQENISNSQIENIAIVMPGDDKEQTAIANYLDRITAEIENLITQKKQLLELYEEEKTTIINQAVTKGINLDVKLKDSGIDWLGEIPEHWVVKKVKHICKIQGRIGFKGYKSSDLVSDGQGALTLGASHISKQHKIDLSNPVFLNWDKYYESPEIMVKKGDIVFTQRGVYLGKVGLIEEDYGAVTINPSLILLKDIKINAKYFSFFLTINYIKSSVEVISSSTAIPMISQEQLANFYCIIPTVEEQILIAGQIEKETSRIDSKVEKTKKLVDLLKEYRTALISEAVTGKIKVIEESEL